MTKDDERQLKAALECLQVSREKVIELEAGIKEEETEQKRLSDKIIRLARGDTNEFPPPTMLKLFKGRKTFILSFEEPKFWDYITRAKNIILQEIKNGFKK